MSIITDSGNYTANRYSILSYRTTGEVYRLSEYISKLSTRTAPRMRICTVYVCMDMLIITVRFLTNYARKEHPAIYIFSLEKSFFNCFNILTKLDLTRIDETHSS